MSRRRTTSHRLSFVGTALLSGAVVLIPRSLAPAELAGTAILLCQAALLGGCLGGAYVWREEPTRSPRVGAQASAVSSVAALLATVILATQLLGDISPAWALSLCLALSLCAGAGIGAGFLGFSNRAGVLTAAYVLGLAAGASAPQRPDALAVGVGAAGAGAAALAVSYWHVLPLTLSLGGLGAGAAALVGLRLGWWPAPPPLTAVASADSLLVPAVWALTGLLVAVAGAMAAEAPSKDPRAPLRLLFMGSLWAGGLALLLWRELGWGQSLLLGDARLAALVLAGGVVVGEASLDAWLPGPAKLRRAAVLGVVGVVALFLLEALTRRNAALGPAQLIWVLVLLGGAGATAGLMVPAAAASGALARPSYSPWIWGTGAAAALLTWAVLELNQPAAGGELATAGFALTLLALLARHEVVLSRESWEAGLAWLRREWGRESDVALPRSHYPGWMSFARAVTYAGYVPWWLAGGVLRIVTHALTLLMSNLAEIVRDVLGSLAELFSERTPTTTAQRVEIQDHAPLVELSPTLQWRSPEGAKRLVDERTATSVVDLLALPIIALAYLLEGASKASSGAIRWITGRRGTRARPPVQLESVAETIPLGPAPDVLPGATITPEELLQRSLLDLKRDPAWKQALRAVLGWSLPEGVRNWLAPDLAEPWDARVFRTEVIGPRGRRFELLGRVWRSPRRRGCVVTIPTLPGNVDKRVEVSVSHRDIRELLARDSATVRSVLLRAAFRLAIADLMVGAVGQRSIVCDSPREDLLEPNQDRQCDLRLTSTGGGYRCRDSLPQDATQGTTTPAACETCTFPEVWERCRDLKLEGTIGVIDHEGRLHRRAHMICRLTGSAVEADQCLTQECFSPITITRVIEVRSGVTE